LLLLLLLLPLFRLMIFRVQLFLGDVHKALAVANGNPALTGGATE
jgi:hypothetical protein